MYFHQAMGNPIHPVYTPDYNFIVKDPEGLSFFERCLSQIYNYIVGNILLDNYLDETSVHGRKYFGEDMPNLKVILHNASMLFITTHPVTHGVRALQPNTVQIGTGMHFKKPQELPKVRFLSYVGKCKN